MIEKFKNWFAENYFWIITIFIAVLWINGCSQTNKQIKINNKLLKNNIELVNTLDSLKSLIPTQEKIQLMLEINGYETSENMLNDYNDFARSKASPTERSRYYQSKKNAAIEKLKKLE
jgi:phosphatidate phosphatase PAH1